MYLSEFWTNHGDDIVLSSVFILASVFLLVSLIINLGKNNTNKKLYIIGGIIFVLALFGVNYVIIRDYKELLVADPDAETLFPIARTMLFNAFVIIIFAGIGYLFVNKRNKVKDKTTVTSVAILALLVALASVLMLFGIPIFPSADYLKVEVSALIYFMVYLWFGIKPTVTVILLTNIIHIIMPSVTAPLVFGLDETANIVACLVFLTPSFIAFRKLDKDEMPEFRKVIATSIVGVILTTVFMVLYNYFIFIPVYEYLLGFPLGFDFVGVLALFGPFNLIKWGLVCIVVIFLYRKLFGLKLQLVRQ
ncbi:MAG: ECF transporter S component [Bacilli bacterium]|nr:hypothetical protein [Bacilli bacterium]